MCNLCYYIRTCPRAGLYYMAPAGALCMILLVVTCELKTMLATGAFWIIHNNPAHFLGASALGFVLNILSFMILKASSALLLKGISVSRTAALVLFCAAFLGEKVSLLEGVGYVVSLACFIWYNAIRIGVAEDKEKHPQKPTRLSPINRKTTSKMSLRTAEANESCEPEAIKKNRETFVSF